MPIFSFLMYIGITSFTPGPNNIMGMVFGNKHGFKKSIRFCLGVGTGYFFVMLACCYLNLLLQDIIPSIQYVMTIIGGAYMLYLAYKILFSKSSNETDEKEQNHIYFTAILLQFINPKGILSGLTVVTTFILPFYHSHISYISLSFLVALSGFLSTLCWSLFGSVFQSFLTKYRIPFNVVMALSLVYISISIFME